MFLFFLLPKDWKASHKRVSVILSLFLFLSITANVSAITAQEVMENALKVYEDIDNYKAVVQTYETDSMEASGRIFEVQQPIISFNLFFRKPNEHAVEQIGKSRHGVFRVEVLSALARLREIELALEGQEHLLGQNCYVLACTSSDEPGTIIKLWVSPRDWTVQQFTLITKSLTLANTQFKYPPGGNRRVRFLPMETRSFFPLSKKVLINRITDYQVNTGVPSEIFEKQKKREQSR